MQSRNRQSGIVLVTVILLLLLVGTLSLLALNTGVFEQRSSGNDVKSKLVTKVAEAGLSQGMEFLHQHYDYMTDSTKWTQCTATDSSFPCGSVPSTRRATMYYWSGGAGYDFDGSGAASGWELKMLPLAANIMPTTTFPATYGVGAVI